MMNSENSDLGSILSEKYQKYLVSLRIRNESFYCVWGSDLSYHFDDKFVLDNKNNIIISKKVSTLLRYLRKENDVNLFDTENTKVWLEMMENARNKDAKIESSSVYDLNILLEWLGVGCQKNLQMIPPLVFKEFTDFVNLIDDYALQTKNKQLIELTHETNLRQFWNVYYDKYIWKTDSLLDFQIIEENTRRSFLSASMLFLTRMRLVG